MTTGLEPVRVLQLVTRMNIGGPARHVLALATGMPDDIRVEVAAGRPPAVEGELTRADVRVHPVPLVRPISPRQDVAAVRAVRRLMLGLGSQVLHTHMAKAGTVGRLAARTPTIRTIHTFHGHVLSGYFSRPAQRVFLEVERRLARRTDVLIAVSDEIRDGLLDLGIGRPSQYEVIPIGLDSTIARTAAPGQLRRAIGVAAETPLAGVVARLVPIKDHATLFHALASVPRLHLAVIGDGELRGELERLAGTLGISDRTHFTGWWHDMPAALADLDIVALSSRNEGTPVALMEAAACGRPIVATDVGGVASVVEPGSNGFLVAPADPTAFAAPLKILTDDASLRQSMGDAGRRRYEASAGLDPTHRLIELYRSLAGAVTC